MDKINVELSRQQAHFVLNALDCYMDESCHLDDPIPGRQNPYDAVSEIHDEIEKLLVEFDGTARHEQTKSMEENDVGLQEVPEANPNKNILE